MGFWIKLSDTVVARAIRRSLQKEKNATHENLERCCRQGVSRVMETQAVTLLINIIIMKAFKITAG